MPPCVQVTTVTSIQSPMAVAHNHESVLVELPRDDQLFMCLACCCYRASCYHAFPECCGVTGKREFLCCKTADQCRCAFNPTCRYMKCEDACCDFREGNDCAETGCGHCYCHYITCCYETKCSEAFAMPTTLCKCAGQTCCCDVRSAFPCDHEVPFQIGCLGCYLVGKPQPQGGVQQTLIVQQTTTMQAVDMER